MATRTFGWVQDSGKIENLRKTVEMFDRSSSTYQELIANRYTRARSRTRWERSVSFRVKAYSSKIEIY